MNNSLYNYKAKFIRAVDGDTVELEVDLGFKIYNRSHFRLIRIDTAEMNSSNTEERALARVAKNYVQETLSIVEEIYINTFKSDKYGRYLADLTYVFEGKNINLSDELLEKGLAVEYNGGIKS